MFITFRLNEVPTLNRQELVGGSGKAHSSPHSLALTGLTYVVAQTGMKTQFIHRKKYNH